MAELIHEAPGTTPSPPAAAAPDPEAFESDDPGWPELPAATGGFTDNAAADYLHRLGHYGLLTAEQEVELAQEIEAGLFAEHLLADGISRPGHDPAELRTITLLGRRAEEELLHANLRLVVWIAKHYTNRGLDFLDLIQEGNLGLHRAVRTFDFTRGFRFSAHATWPIRSAITLAVANQARLIRLPLHVVAQLKTVRAAQRAAAVTGTVCSTEDLSQLANTSIGNIECLLALDEPVFSLESWVPDGRGGAVALAEQLWDSSATEAADSVFHQQLQWQVQAVLATLEDPEARVIAMRFGLPGGEGTTLDVVAKAFGTTRELIRQIEITAMQKLREPARANMLRQYHFDNDSPAAVAPSPGTETAAESVPASESAAESAPGALSPAAPATAATRRTPPRRVPASRRP